MCLAKCTIIIMMMICDDDVADDGFGKLFQQIFGSF